MVPLLVPLCGDAADSRGGIRLVIEADDGSRTRDLRLGKPIRGVPAGPAPSRNVPEIPVGDGDEPGSASREVGSRGAGVVPLLVPLSVPEVLALARAVEADWAAQWAAWAREAA